MMFQIGMKQSCGFAAPTNALMICPHSMNWYAHYDINNPRRSAVRILKDHHLKAPDMLLLYQRRVLEPLGVYAGEKGLFRWCHIQLHLSVSLWLLLACIQSFAP
jgi:hypothetical protein